MTLGYHRPLEGGAWRSPPAHSDASTQRPSHALWANGVVAVRCRLNTEIREFKHASDQELDEMAAVFERTIKCARRPAPAYLLPY